MALAWPGHLHLPGTWLMQWLLRAHFWLRISPETCSLWDRGCQTTPPSHHPYLAGSSGGQAGGQASWLCSRLVIMIWRRSSMVALGSAGGQDAKRSVLGKPVPWAEPRGAALSCPLGSPRSQCIGGAGSRAVRTQCKEKNPCGSEYSLVILIPSSAFLLKALKN